MVQILRSGAGAKAAIEQRLRPIHDDLRGIEIVAAAQAMALGTGSIGAVERKRAGLKLRNADAAVGTRENGGVKCFFSVDHRNQNEAAAELHGERNRQLEAMFDAGLDQQAVDDHLDSVILALVELEIVFQADEFAVHARAGEAMLDELFRLFFEFALTAAHDGRHDHDAVFGRESHHALHDLFGRLARDGLAAFRTMRQPDGRIKQSKVVVDFCDGADRGTRAAAGGFLLDGNGGAQSIDGVHIGALHLIEELACVGGERLDIAALALGIDGIEGERGLARTAQAGDDGQGVARDLDVNVLQVVLARPAHRNLGNGHENFGPGLRC